MAAVGPWLENELAHSISLDGVWQFSLGGGPFREIPVPSAWEAHIADKITDGPAVYRRAFQLPAHWPTKRRVILEFGAVSFDCQVRLNGFEAGAHRGMWSTFQFDVTELVQPGANILEVEVYKPGKRFPPRESLAGFLPDVATAFGGIWQSVRLWALDTAIANLQVRLSSGLLFVSGGVHAESASELGSVGVAIYDPEFDESDPSYLERGLPRAVQFHSAAHGAKFELSIALDDLRHWSPPVPALYIVQVTIK
ncbi:MAG: sugar-binding domain-containing protein, partial [Anaerolineales bacterium]